MTAVRLHHHTHGRAGAPPVLLAPSLGTTGGLWDGLVDALADRYRVLCFDTRGHGKSPAPAGPYTVTDLCADVLALSDAHGIDTFAVVGLSLGGAIAQTLALDHPHRVSALVLAATGPAIGNPDDWRQRASRVRAEGMDFLTEPTPQRWFTGDFLATRPDEATRLLDMLRTTPPEGYAGCCEALASYDVTDRLPEITAPTRVIAGAQDPVTPPDVGKEMAAHIPHADLVVIDDASHITNVAQPETFNHAVRDHLDRHL